MLTNRHMEKISVLIVEDNAEYRQGLVWMLATDLRLEVVGALPDATDIGAEITRLRPQVVLLDYKLGNSTRNGLDALTIVLTIAPDTQVIMLTGHEDDDLILKAIHLGVNGYLVKAKASTELIDAIIMVAEGGSPMTSYIARRVLALMRKAEQNQQALTAAVAVPPPLSSADRTYADRLGLLTPREEEVLKCLTEGKSYKMAASQLGIAVDTVSNHLRAVYRKLQVNSMSEAVAIALRVWLATGRK